jgi:hypothetical protein
MMDPGVFLDMIPADEQDVKDLRRVLLRDDDVAELFPAL